MCSQVSPMRSSAPGAKFSTSTSHCLTSRSRISLPLGCLLSIVIERLLAVEHGEVEAVGALHVAQLAARDVADAGPLHLDHIGAHIGEELGAGRPRLHVREVENFDAVERPARLAQRLGRRPRSPLLAAAFAAFAAGFFALSLTTFLVDFFAAAFGFALAAFLRFAILFTP